METRKIGHMRYIFIVSDATGKTCTRVVNAALRQFKTTDAKMEIVTFVRTRAQIDELIDRVAFEDLYGSCLNDASIRIRRNS